MAKAFVRIALVIVIISGALAISKVMFSMKEEAKSKDVTKEPPMVKVMMAELENVKLDVSSFGTVTPKRELSLIPEITGRVLWVSETLVAGGFFNRGDLLVKIDPRDYELALIQAEAAVISANAMYKQEKARAEYAKFDLRKVKPEERTEVGLRIPQLEMANASLVSAKAAVESVKRNIERAEIRAPFSGRVRKNMVEEGQFVAMGSPLASIYSTESAEIRLPVKNSELRFLKLKPNLMKVPKEERPEVTIKSEFAGQSYEWKGKIVRIEGEIDPMSRMVYLVAEIEKPYSYQQPLMVGMFVTAIIDGIQVDNLVRLPRVALRSDNTILHVDEDKKLRPIVVNIIKHEGDTLLVDDMPSEIKWICVSDLTIYTDGMRVKTSKEKGITE